MKDNNASLIIELKRVEKIISKLLSAINSERKRNISSDELEEEYAKMRLKTLPKIKENEKVSQTINDFVLKRNKEFIRKYYAEEDQSSGYG